MASGSYKIHRVTKQKIQLLIPLLTIAGLLIYSWLKILSTDFIATWQHYLALGLFSVLLFLLIKNFKAAVIATGLYLLLATFTVLSLTPEVTASWLRIGSIDTPHINLLSFGLLILFFVLNLNRLIDIYLDYKETGTKSQ
jgi:hypothetical protein